MVEDDIIRELRAVREEFAQSHGFDVHAMVAELQAQDLADDWPVVRRPPRTPVGPIPFPTRPTESIVPASPAGN
jgi:hypothetical protein